MKWPCVFRGAFIRTEVDPRVQRLWKERYGRGAPFGDLRLSWRNRHCSELNPYGSDSCPYAERDCALAFYKAVQIVCADHVEHPMALFQRVAFSYAQDRADHKPLARDTVGTDVRPGNAGSGRVRDDEGPAEVPRPSTRPVGIGDVLRSLDLGSRERSIDEGQEGSE